MSGTSEQWWEKKLNIKTSGMIDHFFEMDCNYYEPTDYRVLDALAKSGYITAENHILDYGCGLGRSVLFLSAMTGCRATGIEFDSTKRVSTLFVRTPGNTVCRMKTASISSILSRTIF